MNKKAVNIISGIIIAVFFALTVFLGALEIKSGGEDIIVNGKSSLTDEAATVKDTVLYRLFGASGSDQVIAGKDGWLFYNETLNDYIGAAAMTDEEIEERLADLRAMNPILSDKLIYSRKVPLSVRAGIATPVADGYVALGDSAFMTIPIMGSGIEAGMHGASIFADYVIAKDVQDFTADNMWPFYVEYFKKFGKGFALLDIVRRHALRFKAKYINWALSGKFVTDDTLKFIMLTKEDPRKPKYKLFMFSAILWKLIFNPSFNCAVLRMAGEGIHAMSVASHIPSKYSYKKIAKWTKKYDNLIAKCESKAAKRKR